jgi:hypothetical protein
MDPTELLNFFLTHEDPLAVIKGMKALSGGGSPTPSGTTILSRPTSTSSGSGAKAPPTAGGLQLAPGAVWPFPAHPSPDSGSPEFGMIGGTFGRAVGGPIGGIIGNLIGGALPSIFGDTTVNLAPVIGYDTNAQGQITGLKTKGGGELGLMPISPTDYISQLKPPDGAGS